MALSSITVSGVTPNLSILGASQRFVFNTLYDSVAWGVNNTFNPTIANPSYSYWEFRNLGLDGYRWQHETVIGDTYGRLTLQSFVNGGGEIDLFTTNQGNTITFLVPIFLSTTLNMSNQLITNLATPVGPTDATTKAYVDGVIGLTITLTGAVTGTGTGTIATTLTPITTSQITDFNSSVVAYRLDQFTAPTTSVSLGSQKITDLATPTAATDAVNKTYVDTLVKPYGALIMIGNGIATALGVAGTYSKVEGTTTLVTSSSFTSPVSNRLTYTGTATIQVKVSIDVSFTDDSNAFETFAIYKNGTIASASIAPILMNPGTSVGQISISGLISLATNDYLEIYVQSSSASTDVVAVNLNFNVVAI